MKQQDRLEEREQDIEDQLYKLESDKRLVEVSARVFVEEAAILPLQSVSSQDSQGIIFFTHPNTVRALSHGTDA